MASHNLENRTSEVNRNVNIDQFHIECCRGTVFQLLNEPTQRHGRGNLTEAFSNMATHQH